MSKNKVIDAAFDDSPVDVSTEVNFIWSIANTLRGPYKSDKYKDVIIPMVIIRRFECALAGTKAKSLPSSRRAPLTLTRRCAKSRVSSSTTRANTRWQNS